MNEIIITDKLGNTTTTKVSDSELKKYQEIGITFKLISKVEKPNVLKEKDTKD